MMNKAIPLLFFLIIIGIRVAFYLVERPSVPTSLGNFQTSNPLSLTIKLPPNRGTKEFIQLKEGMTFTQVTDVFEVGFEPKDPRTSDILKSPEYLAKFKIPDGSSIWIIFRDGKVATKDIYTSSETYRLEQGQ